MTATCVGESQPEPQQEWTRVVRRKGRSRPSKTSHSSKTSSAAVIPSAPSLTRDDLVRDHQYFAGPWKSSTCAQQLRETVSSRANRQPISQAICFGIGSFDPADGASEVKRRAHVQLAAFLLMAEAVQQHPIRCFFQEPLFNSAEKEFIESLGHSVVSSPAGFQQVDPSTLVFGVHLYRDIYSQVLARHIPTVFVGTSYSVWEDFHGPESLDWARMKELDQACEKINFPEERGDTTFSGTTIHWKRSEEP
ncbi:hypothetical protein F4780DRAFT_781724 [Xylariomycetidae sp. FL0641]|nr:hypothetical protein F4780DRAFT_781724 [Xylariomycetidae sp. FL0641]